MNTNPLYRAALATLFLAMAACAEPSRQPRYCPLPYGGSPTDTVVLNATPAQGKMGRHVQVWLQVPAAARPELSGLRLFINGHPVPGLPSRQIGARCAVRDSATKAVVALQEVHEFDAVRNDASRDMWAHLLGGPDSYVDTVRVGAGLGNGPEFKFVNDSTSVAFTVAEPSMVWTVGIVLLLLLLVLVFTRAAAVLRDPAVKPKPPSPAKEPPFSLAKVVMAMWTFLILGGFMGIWLITGDHRGILTPQSLLLLGIAGGSAAVSATITRRQNARVAEESRAARLQLITLEEESRSLAAQAHEVIEPGTRSALLQRSADLAQAAGTARAVLQTAEGEAPVSRGFLLDLLYDGDTPALHRVQNLVWNLVLGIVFVVSTYRALVFPEFDPMLLGLMGISEAVYLGLKPASGTKLSENQLAATAAAMPWWSKLVGRNDTAAAR